MLRRNFLKEKLEAGRTVVGTWLVVPSPVLADVVASSGLDFAIVDGEHGPITSETAQQMVIACESRGVSPGVRVPGVCESDILKALDIGAHFVHVPNVTNRRQVETVVQHAKYPPLGNRGFSPFTRAGDYSVANAAKLANEANESVLLGIHIEGSEAIASVDEILTVGALDIVFVGLFDISKSLGIPGQVEDPKVRDVLRTVCRKAAAAGKYTGTIANSLEQAREFIDIGVRYITYSVDCHVIRTAFERIVHDFRELVCKMR
jgi:4-hydroxy-2-oxoheptanedioate aldolase